MILLDNCVPLKFKKYLEGWNYSATTVSAHIPKNSSDESVIQLAKQLKAILPTVDLDFSNILDYPPDKFNGIMVLRYQIADEQDLFKSLKQALDDLYPEKVKGVLVIVTPTRYRIRHSDIEDT